jgi:hypothetical protein
VWQSEKEKKKEPLRLPRSTSAPSEYSSDLARTDLRAILQKEFARIFATI